MSEPWSLPTKNSLQAWENGPHSLTNKVIGHVTQPRRRQRCLRGSEERNTGVKGEGRWHLSCILKMDNTFQLDSHAHRACIGCLLFSALRMQQQPEQGPSPKKLTILVGEDC